MSYGRDGRIKEYAKLAMFALLAVVVGLITVLYLRGDLPLPFLPEPSLEQIPPNEPLKKPQSGADNPVSQPIDGGMSEEALQYSFERLLALFPAVSGEVSSEFYDPTRHKLTFLKALPALEEGYLSSANEEEDDDETAGLPQLYARQGFLFRSNADKTTSLFDADGQVIFETVPDDLTLLSARDSLDRPVFLQGKKYVYFDAETRTFLPADYDPEEDDRGLEYDYPAYFGKSDSDAIVLVYSDGTVGCAKGDKPGTLLLSGYADAFGPKEGFVVFVNAKGKLSVRRVDSIKKPAFSAYSLYLPDTFGEESMGYFYFDHGLMRARLKIMSGKKVLSDEEVILRSDGTVFPVPADYKVVSYSDGVFLLEKDGLYGYYSHEGKWISAPVYTYARPFFEGVAVCGYQDGKKCVIDTTGKCVVPYYFQEIGDCSGGLIPVYSGIEGWSVLQKVS